MSLRIFIAGLLVLLGAGALALFLVLRPAPPPDHRILINGTVLSLDDQDGVYEAISIRGTRIEQLGTTADIAELRERGTVVTDLRGMTVVPGFIDAHGHFPGSGLAEVSADLNSPPIGAVHSIADIQQLLAEQAERRGGWVLGFGYDDTLLAEARHPTRDDLDEVSTERPIYITHVSGHMGVANSVALEQLGITADSVDPVGGVIVRVAGSRRPSGLLEESAHMAAAQQAMDFGVMDFFKMAIAANREYISRGVTLAQSGGVDGRMTEGLALLTRLFLVSSRVVVFPMQDTLGKELLAGTFDPSQHISRRFQIGPIKIVADGSIQGYTGYLSEPYHTPFHGDAEYRGYPIMPAEDLAELVARYHTAGYQMAIHGNGDAAIDDILDAFEAAQQQRRIQDPRLILIHAQMAREDQLLRMRRLGVTPSFFSAHTYYWGDRHRDIFMGPDRAARMSPTGSSEEIGLRYSVHLDTPVVPMEPLQLLWSTVNRRSTSGEVIGPEQSVSVIDALKAMTIDAAWQIFRDDTLGSLVEGKFADLVILSGNPVDDPEGIRDLEVVETLVGGRSVYHR